MQKKAEPVVDGTQIAIAGRFLRTARLRHEWFEFPEEPLALIKGFHDGRPIADLFTFIQEGPDGVPKYPFYNEPDGASILTIGTFDAWWKKLDFKVRNKIRKAQKIGVELRLTSLDDDLVRGVKSIYDESPLRQGRKFWHYGKSLDVIKNDLSSFPERTCFVGAYHRDELIGFMKLYEGNNILRTVHIIAKLSQRDKPVQDALIAKAVEICEQKHVAHLHYGAWSKGGLGTFKIKHGFMRVDSPRYFVPLTCRGRLMLRFGLHHRIQDLMPEKWMERLLAVRGKWNLLRYGSVVELRKTDSAHTNRTSHRPWKTEPVQTGEAALNPLSRRGG